jgi:hypothetical protein
MGRMKPATTVITWTGHSTEHQPARRRAGLNRAGARRLPQCASTILILSGRRESSMRRTLILSAVLVFLISSIGVAQAAVSSSAEVGSNERGDHGARIQVLHVTRATGDDVILDLDHSATAAHPAPDSVGDEDVFTADFYVGDTNVGLDGGVCKLAPAAIYNCVATNSFAKGDLTVQFLADFTQTAPGHFAITGGTGATAVPPAKSHSSIIPIPNVTT